MIRLRQALVVLSCAGLGTALFALSQRPASGADVRRAARELVPAGLTVTEAASGAGGGNPFGPKGPYFSSIDATGPQDMAELEAAVRARAQAAGWPPPEMEDWPGARLLEYERGDLSASIHLWRAYVPVPHDPKTFSVSVKATGPDRLGPGLLGAVAGAGAGALGIGARRRRAGSAEGPVLVGRGEDAPWLAGLGVIAVAFAATWVAQPWSDHSDPGKPVEQAGSVVLVAGPVVLAVAALLGLTRLGRSWVARWLGVTIALPVPLLLGWLFTFFTGIDCEDRDACTMVPRARAAGTAATVGLWLVAWWLCRTWSARRAPRRAPGVSAG